MNGLVWGRAARVVKLLFGLGLRVRLVAARVHEAVVTKRRVLAIPTLEPAERLWTGGVAKEALFQQARQRKVTIEFGIGVLRDGKLTIVAVEANRVAMEVGGIEPGA